MLAPPCSRQGLPPPHVAMRRCELLPHSFHLFLLRGSFVSVALSLGLPPVTVSNCLVLCCPDFPLTLPTFVECKRSSSALPHSIIPHFYADDWLSSASRFVCCSSKIRFTSPSASVLNSRRTCVNITSSNCVKRSRIRSLIGHNSRFFTV